MRKSLPYIIILASILWLGNIFPANAAEVCTIKSATFSPSGAQNASWYTDARPPKVTLTITGENCAGKTVEVSITEDDTILSNDDDIAQLDNKPFIFPSTGNSFSINLSAGETDCSDYLNAGGKDCDYFISVYKAAGGTFTSSKQPSGNLTYDCDNLCDKSWSLWAPGSNTAPALNPAGGNTSTSTYNLLAPLPGSNGQLVKTVDVSGSNALADYINTIIRLTIGLAAVLAVLMIIMGGLEYITSELPGAKGEGKQKITNAVVGLLVALGAWVLLYTINPKLVETDLSNLQTTTIQYIEGPEIDADPSSICGKTNAQGITSCDSSNLVNIVFLGKGVTVHKSIAADLKIIDTAWKNSTDPSIKNYRINSVGGYNPRSAVGSNTNPSAHAFGLAIDINPSTNPYIDSPSPCTTDMPKAFVQLFTSRGFGWGGFWKTKKDAMHFSRASNEAGYTSGTCSGLK